MSTTTRANKLCWWLGLGRSRKTVRENPRVVPKRKPRMPFEMVWAFKKKKTPLGYKFKEPVETNNDLE